jgi:alpha-galactosidase
MIRTLVLPPRPEPAQAPVLVNSWEAMYFSPTEDRILNELVLPGQQLGLDMVVLDDGWFGNRMDDQRALGDWYVDRQKFPHGLSGLTARVKSKGMQFGIWMEPEMVNRDSHLYRQRPDWCLHVKDRPRTESRNQLVLDLSREDVQKFVVDAVSTVIESADISYLKWDFNRHLTEIGNEILPAERQGEILHRYYLGLYAILAQLRHRFPRLVIEGCSGGGGRFDLGMLFYSPQYWTSDNTDGVSRVHIQYGTSLFYPPDTMTAHVSVVPNHQNGRVTAMSTRHIVAMAGVLGYELRLNDLTGEDADLVRQGIVFWKSLIQPLVFEGDMYRLTSPFMSPEDDMQAMTVGSWMYVAPERKKAVVFVALTGYRQLNSRIASLRLDGLDEECMYKVKRYHHQFREPEHDYALHGATLMYAGLVIKMDRDADALLFYLEAAD